MPRPRRYQLSGIPQHVIQRGNNRQATFFADEDYLRYLQDLNTASQTHQCDIHAYVLMTNHVHLLITPHRPDGISKTMQSLGRRYVTYINQTYQRSGTLWEGRYKAALIDSDHYLLTCQRYIELNPVRAPDMAGHPQDYRWSSYRANALGATDEIITPHPQYRALGTSAQQRQAAYRGLFDAHIQPRSLAAIRDSLNQCRVYGSDRFKDQIEFALSRRVRPGKAGRPRKQKDDGKGE